MSALTIKLLNINYALRTLGRQARPRVLVNSIPKSGTNLIVSLALAYGRMRLSGPVIAARGDAALLARRPGLIIGHIEALDATVAGMGLDDGYLLGRDPGAYAVSLARYIDVNPRHPAHRALAGRGAQALLRAAIEGVEAGGFRLEPVHRRYARYLAAARQGGLRIADFDRLLAGPAPDTPEAALLRHIGGPDHAAGFEAALARSRGLSTTYRHSRRSTTDFTLDAALRAHPDLREAERLYADALRH